MGRTIIVEDGIEDYTTALAAKKEPVAGLIFGQEINAQKSCVIHLSRSPEPLVEDLEDRSDDIPTGKSKTASTKSSKKTQNAADFFEEAVVLDHTQQVMRTLPGGITILGVFVISELDPFQNSIFNNRVRKLLTAIESITGKSTITIRQQLTCERIVLHVNNLSMKYTTKTVDIASPIASPKPADWKFVAAAGSPWIELYCTLNIEFFITLSDLESSGSLRQQVEAGLKHYNEAVKQCICVIDGNIPSESDLLVPPESSVEKGKKRPKQAAIEERMKTLNIQLLIPEPEMKSSVQRTVAELRFGGQMCVKAYIHSKATVREAYQVIREDIIRSLWARCDMHCDSLVGDEQRGKPHVRPVLHEPPRRVLAPLPFSPLSISDYLFPGEGPADSLTSLADLLDLGALMEGDIQDYWEAAAEVNEVLEEESVLDTAPTQQLTVSNPNKSRIILLSALIALLAIFLSYLTLQVARSE